MRYKAVSLTASTDRNGNAYRHSKRTYGVLDTHRGVILNANTDQQAAKKHAATLNCIFG